MYLHPTLQTQPVILDRRFRITIVAVDPSFRVLKLGRHGLAFNGALEVPELHFHVYNASTAYGTAVRSLHVLVIAAMMDAVATPHEDDGLR